MSASVTHCLRVPGLIHRCGSGATYNGVAVQVGAAQAGAITCGDRAHVESDTEAFSGRIWYIGGPRITSGMDIVFDVIVWVDDPAQRARLKSPVILRRPPP